MSIRKDDKWLCNICMKPYGNSADALSCENSHDVVYVALRRDDLRDLIMFIYTRDESLLKGSLIETLMRYRSQMIGRKVIKE